MARMREEGRTDITGKDAFFLWDTYGFPVDLTRDVAQDNGLTIDEAGFRTALAEQKQRSQDTAVEVAAAEVAVYAEHFSKLRDAGIIEPTGVRYRIYENLSETDTTVAALFVDGQPVEEANSGQPVEVLLPETVFYVEAGGQMSDTGEIYYWPENLNEPVWSIQVTDMRRPIPGMILHVGTVTAGTVAGRRSGRGRHRHRSALGHHAQPHGHTCAARRAARSPGRARPPGRLAGRAGAPALRLHPRPVAQR